MILNRLIAFFSRTITIRVQPEIFHFTTGTDNLQLETYLNIQLIDGKYTVHSAGEDASTTSGIMRVDLFRNSDVPADGNRMECLIAYLRYVIQKLHRRNHFIRPLVIVKDVHSLDDVLMGYQYQLLRAALLECGAREVQFE